MTLAEFAEAFGAIEPAPWQKKAMDDLATAVRVADKVKLPLNRRSYLRIHPFRHPFYDEPRHRPVQGGHMVKDCRTGEVHEPLIRRREPWE